MTISCRSLTGAWIETLPPRSNRERPHVAPLRGRGLKQKHLADYQSWIRVAPLRGRGLKLDVGFAEPNIGGRSLTGAWIETTWACHEQHNTASRSLTGAWIETDVCVTV